MPDVVLRVSRCVGASSPPWGPGSCRCSRGGLAAQQGPLQLLRVPGEAVTGAELAPRQGHGMPVNRPHPPGRLNGRLCRELPSQLPGSLVSVALAFRTCSGPLTEVCRGQACRALVEGRQFLLGFGGPKS